MEADASGNPPGPTDAEPPAPGATPPPGRLPVRRAPLVPAAAAMIAGILAGRYLPLPIGAWAAGGVAALAAAAASLLRPHLRGVSIAATAAAIACAAAGATNLAYHRVPENHVVTYSRTSAVPTRVRGQVVSDPRIRSSAEMPWLQGRTYFVLDTGAIRRADGTWIATAGKLRVTIGEPAYDLACGDEVELIGTLSRPRAAGNPGQYDRQKADRHERIFARFFVPGADGVSARRVAGLHPLRRIGGRLRAMARGHLKNLGDEQDAVLLNALVLGERAGALRSLNRTMIDAGVAHFLSISGLHLGIFLGLVYCLCRVLMLPPRRAATVVLAVLVLYLVVAEPRSPLLRGAIMAAAVCLAAIAGRGVSTVNALAAAAVVLLVADPLQLFRCGFQLSFGTVCGIILLKKPVTQLLFGRWLRRRELMVFAAEQRVRRWLYRSAADWAIGLVAITLAAHLAAAPLVAYHFGVFSPYAPLLSVLLLPIMVLVLTPAYASLALAWPLPNASAGLGQLAAAAAGLMRGTVGAFKALPGLSVELYAVPAWFVMLCYATLGLWAAAGTRRRARLPAAGATVAVLAAAVLTQLPAPRPAAARLHVLDVGHGAMTLLHARDGRTWLFDAGTIGAFDAYHDVLRPFLRAKRLPAPQGVFISHANVDHFTAVPPLLAHRPPARVFVNELFGNLEDDSPAVAQLTEAMASGNVQVVRLRRGQDVSLGDGARVEVLWPPAADEAGDLDANDTSLVLRLVAGRRRVLMPGDVGEAVMQRLVAAGGDRLAGDVLILPHHGKYTPALEPFVRTVGAEVLVQSNSRRPDKPELLEAIAGRRRLATFRDGWIQLDLDDEAVRVRTMRP